MPRIYSICNQKGGVGKTTTAVNIATFLASTGRKVLLIDLDPQANATSAAGLSKSQITSSIYDVLIEGADPADAIKETKIKGLFILPSNTSLAGAEIELVGEMAREFKLREALKRVDSSFEFIIMDTPPSLSLMTINALAATDDVIIPIQCEYFALEGLSQLLKTIDLVKNSLHKDLKIGGIVLTMYDQRLILNNEVMEEVREHFPDLVFETTIPRNVRLSEAPSHGMPILYYDPTSSGAVAYENLTREMLDRQRPEAEADIVSAQNFARKPEEAPQPDPQPEPHQEQDAVSAQDLARQPEEDTVGAAHEPPSTVQITIKEEVPCQQMQSEDLAEALEP